MIFLAGIENTGASSFGRTCSASSRFQNSEDFHGPMDEPLDGGGRVEPVASHRSISWRSGRSNPTEAQSHESVGLALSRRMSSSDPYWHEVRRYGASGPRVGVSLLSEALIEPPPSSRQLNQIKNSASSLEGHEASKRASELLDKGRLDEAEDLFQKADLVQRVPRRIAGALGSYPLQDEANGRGSRLLLRSGEQATRVGVCFIGPPPCSVGRWKNQ